MKGGILRSVFQRKSRVETQQEDRKRALLRERFVRVASLSEIPLDTGKVVVAMGREIGLFHVDGKLEAIDNICPHSYRPIGTAGLKGGEVTCVWHGLKFDLGTGTCPEAPHYSVAKYRVRVEGEDVFVGPPECTGSARE
ncbi:MAG: nitrite reductase (NAD(P)H) small subunit [bacterium]|nr:nitrite reductase (NAD(P)H) small subunit [bacterium]